MLFKAFNYLMDRLDNPLVLKYCSVSCKDLLINNKQILSTKKHDLVNLYNTKIKDKALVNLKYLSLQEGIIQVICYSSAENYNKESIRANIVEMMKTWIIYLNEVEKKITAQDPSNLTKQEILAILQLLDVLKSFSRGCFEGLDNSNLSIMAEIFKEIWPKIKIIINAFSTKSDIIEGIIQLTKYFMRGMKDDFKIYLEEYIKCLIDGYKLAPISSYIYGFEVLLTVFSKDSSVRTIIDNLFSEFCQITFDNYLTSLSDLTVSCELGEDFFGMLNRLVKLNPFVFFDSPQIEKIIQLCVGNIGINEIELGKSIIMLLCKILTYYKLPEFAGVDQEVINMYARKINIIVIKYSDEIVRQILQTFYEVPPASITDLLKDLVFDLILYSGELALKTFEKHLVSLPSDCLTDKEKENFISYIRNYNEEKLDQLLDRLIKRCQNKHIRGKNSSKVL